MWLKLPLGLEFFKVLREESCYYVDKTALIKKLVTRAPGVLLLTRPRRFGKTLTLTMLEDFFSIERDSRERFAGLAISREKELCEKWQNKSPVVFLTLKGVEGLSFESAYGGLQSILADACSRYGYLAKSEKVSAQDKEIFDRIWWCKASRDEVQKSLVTFCRMMKAHHGVDPILLVDEYDVPLAKASDGGYYREMMEVIRAMLGSALKTNPNLKFAVLTGCLRIARESIFTGLNNLVVDDVTGGEYAPDLGFSPAEVEQMLRDADLMDHAAEIKNWYDGYRIGKSEAYCPWSVIRHVDTLQYDARKPPKNYWANTSHNDIIYHFIEQVGTFVQDDFARLMNGGYVITELEEHMTYDYAASSVKNFWSLLYLTGYLTRADDEVRTDESGAELYALRIPNKEVRQVFKSSLIDWAEGIAKGTDRKALIEALFAGEERAAEDAISDLLFQTISYHDYRESFYHAFLAGLFAGERIGVKSNYESGLGRPDLVALDYRHRRALVIEMKCVADKKDIEPRLTEALSQIKTREYLEGLDEGFYTRLAYAVVFCKKRCYLRRYE